MTPVLAAVLWLSAARGASAQVADAAVAEDLARFRLEFAAAVAGQKALALAELPPAQAVALIKRKLAGSGVPDAYVDAVFADPRAKLYADIPAKFGTPTKPVPPVPYDQYRKYFVTDANLDAGVRFVRDHRDLLDAVQAKYHVDGVLLVGLVCVETRYGTATGKYQVVDALDTIVQKVPQRSAWAAREAAEFLKMTHAQGMDAHAVLGSYAGAFGFVQFEPSTYNLVAVDFDGDGKRMLDQWPDALASAADYLARAGYDPAAPFTASSKIGRALFSYNHSDNYVQVILDLREEILKRKP
ncbi:MAG: lytic murein transglycosylase [Elusimicrobia bacterium]|nr:lytic murein transglycosylase [Elusimicrobiota bacterium]